ncbi:MAG: UDP-glucose/GDP-mannose dehydrogenase family protein [Candidatus Babeliaceae bacterium]|jgi:UDPglucose 6-dehydrogenase
MKHLFFYFLIIFCNYNFCTHLYQKVSVIGTGYVGLVTGVCLAHIGHSVICADIDSKKINGLQNGIVPIMEEHLDELIASAVCAGNLTFTDDISAAVKNSDIIFIAVGTPANADGESNVTALYNVMHTISENLDAYKVICIKSTVPLGVIDALYDYIATLGNNKNCDLVFNPEFLREGQAVNDFLHPNRIIIGTKSLIAQEKMQQLYYPFIERSVPFLVTDPMSAETIKYACNGFLATKIAYINEIARLCEVSGANIVAVQQGMMLDERIGKSFLNPGPGFGGSCFPKDCLALAHIGDSCNIDLKIVKACFASNESHKKSIVNKILHTLGNNPDNKTVTILGLAFKAGTDDVRDSPAITIIEKLLPHRVHIKAYDPVANANMQKIFPHIEYCSSMMQALEKSDLVVILTEWEEFKYLPIEQCMYKNNLIKIIDTRNILNGKLRYNHGEGDIVC